jgi:phosphoribosyl-AMP cyclohydrolase / phosphoribosyl-ATP pyrophosphohydrolase
MIQDNLTPDFKKGLIPAIIQDSNTKNVLMLGYMNQEAFGKSVEENRVTFYSRSKQRLWTKGETSGNYLTIKSIALDCDNDTILIKAEPSGPVCHKGTDTCFGNANTSTDLGFLEATIQDRIANPKASSYTTSLLESGINKVAQKVGEEAIELVIESKDDNDELFLNEAADLMYHYLVLLAAKGFELNDVINVLKSRRT